MKATHWISRTQLAEFLRRHPGTIDRYVETGRLPPPENRNPLGTPIWKRSTIMEYLRKHDPRKFTKHYPKWDMELLEQMKKEYDGGLTFAEVGKLHGNRSGDSVRDMLIKARLYVPCEWGKHPRSKKRNSAARTIKQPKKQEKKYTESQKRLIAALRD